MPTIVKVAGVNLAVHAHMITTLSGQLNAPEVYGRNLFVPDGDVVVEKFVPKRIGGRPLSLSMVVLPAAGDGWYAANQQAQFNANLRVLMTAMFQPHQLLPIEAVDKETGVTLYGRAEYVSGMEPRVMGKYRAVMTVELRMLDPYWYTNAAWTAGKRLW